MFGGCGLVLVRRKTLSQSNHKGLRGWGLRQAWRQRVNLPLEQIAGDCPPGPAFWNQSPQGSLLKVQAQFSLAWQRQGLRMDGKVGCLGQNRAFEHSLKLRAGLQPLQSLARSVDTTQTARRLRPLARRALITARPPRVRMRARKPWVRARLTLDG